MVGALKVGMEEFQEGGFADFVDSVDFADFGLAVGIFH